MKTAALLGVLGAVSLCPALASAQDPGDGGGDPDAPGGTEVELGEDPEPPPEDMDGTSENPDAPKLIDDDSPGGDDRGPAAPAAKRTGYPIEEIDRPLTLPAVTSEVGLDTRATFGNLDVEFGLEAQYGITRQWQLGLRYGIGGLFDKDGEDIGDGAKFQTGKAFGLDVTYLVFDWLSVRLSLPVYVDPFAMGGVIGAPMKFKIADKLALVTGEDALEIKFAKFVPSLRSEAANTAAVALDDVGTTLSNANLRLGVGVIYQMSPKMAIRGDFAQRFTNIGGGSDTPGVDSASESPTSIGGQVQYSPSAKLDVVGGASIEDMAAIGDSFTLRAGVAFRI